MFLAQSPSRRRKTRHRTILCEYGPSQQSMKFILEVHHPVPSLNKLFAMNPWQRKKEKVATQDAFLSALRALGDDSVIQITSSGNTLSIVSAIAVFSAEIQKHKLISESRSKKSKAGKPRKLSSK